MMLSSRTDQQISWMLDEYGIKHGPVVDSTRALYEKKLREAMAKERKARRPADRTFYREEEVTYAHHRRPLRQEGFGDDWRTHSVLRSRYEEPDAVDEAAVFRTLSHRPPHGYQTQRDSSPENGPGRIVPLWLQVLLFLIVVFTLVFVFINMEDLAETEPFRRLT